MRSAVIVSTARTPIGRAYRGAFNDTQSQALGGHVIGQAVQRAGIDPAEVEDVVMGAAFQQGAQGFNIARQAALRAGLPDSVAGMSVDRQCASGLMAIATAAKQIIQDDMQITVGSGLESISLVQTNAVNRVRAQDPDLVARVPGLYMMMIETADEACDWVRAVVPHGDGLGRSDFVRRSWSDEFPSIVRDQHGSD
ncbi:MAG: acetyl-CoA C-acetyltransferase [Acetobacteraceae bacterium]|nr:acetyl-CoA C-acetyltransferase [Acetobacteraceae bacterium]